MALRIHMERVSYDRNVIYFFHRGVVRMSNPFDDFSPEILAGWYARVSSKEQWLNDMQHLWESTASDEIVCKTCRHFDEDCQAADAEECPQVIAEFNLDDRHFN